MSSSATLQKEQGIYVALLRGINVGGKHRMAMKDLAALFCGVGCSNVLTYIQSGNVVFRADAEVARRLPALITRAIAETFGFVVPVVTRTAAEIAALVVHNPFLQAGADPQTLHVAFLLDMPPQARIDMVNPHHSPPDEFVMQGRDIYLRYPNGVARSKLTTQYFDTVLATTSTMRNWNTIIRLRELAEAGG